MGNQIAKGDRISTGSPAQGAKRSQSLRGQSSFKGQHTLNGQLVRIVDELVRRGLTLEQARSEFEKQFIVSSLRTHDGSIGRSAKSLGIHRNTLRNKVSTLGISPEDYEARTGRR